MIILLIATLMCVTVRAQEDKPFITAGLGTQATSDVFRGTSVSFSGGYNIKSVDLGLSLDYYSYGWGHDRIGNGYNDWSIKSHSLFKGLNTLYK